MWLKRKCTNKTKRLSTHRDNAETAQQHNIEEFMKKIKIKRKYTWRKSLTERKKKPIRQITTQKRRKNITHLIHTTCTHAYCCNLCEIAYVNFIHITLNRIFRALTLMLVHKESIESQVWMLVSFNISISQRFKLAYAIS